MAALRVNIIANYLGQFWMVAMGLLSLIMDKITVLMDAERPFEILETQRQGGRRDVERPRRAAQRAGAGQRFHELQVGERDHSVFLN